MDDLKRQIIIKKKELAELECQLLELEEKTGTEEIDKNTKGTSLTNEEINRYSRQLILSEISIEGQLSLKNAKVLVVGCGGLGCPVAIYLTAAGVGTIGLVDYDVVEVTNLHRQVAHTSDNVGLDKCTSLSLACKRLNPNTRMKHHRILLDTSNAMEVIGQYDIVVDATDNVPTRYLLSDACVLLDRKPLVSGSALKFDGQLTVYNQGDSPCYRCLHPSPPPANTVNNCSDGGVVGPVVGMIGSLQALEVIKIITGMTPSYAGKLLTYDGLEGTHRAYKLRGRQANCRVCGVEPRITQLQDYPQFCCSSATDKSTPLSLLNEDDRISAKEYKAILDAGEKHILVDVREPTELKICQLPHPTINIRMKDLRKEQTVESLKRHLATDDHSLLVAVCRRGNNSQKAVQYLKHAFAIGGVEECAGGDNKNNNDNGEVKYLISNNGEVSNENHTIITDKNSENFIKISHLKSVKHKGLRMVDIVGGFYAWSSQVDSSMPIY